MDRVERFFIGMAISGFVGLLVTVVGRLALAGYFEEHLRPSAGLGDITRGEGKIPAPKF